MEKKIPSAFPISSSYRLFLSLPVICDLPSQQLKHSGRENKGEEGEVHEKW